MKQLIILLAIALTVACCDQTKQEPSNDHSELSARLDSLGQSYIDGGNLVGFAVAVMDGEDLLYNEGFGYTDLNQTNPVTTETRFLMASVSKLIGSTVVMKLVEEGKLSLDQSLSELLPDFPNQEHAEKITLRHLLSHTSGLKEYAVVLDSNYVRTGLDPTEADFYNFLKNAELDFEPGTNYRYCNSGFWLMGMIVERVTGNTYQEAVDRIINKPAGTKIKLIEEATNYPEMSEYWEKKDSIFVPYPHWTWIKGDGGLTSTPAMLARFPRLWAKGDIISQDSYYEMTKPCVLKDEIETGYGLGVRNGVFLDELILGHTGGHKSTYSIMVYFPERDLSIVCMINTDNTPTNSRKIFEEFGRAVLGKEKPNYAEEATEELSMYVGKYSNGKIDMGETIEIRLDDNGKLSYCIQEDCYSMKYIDANTFWIEEWPYDLVRFQRDRDGNSIALREFYSGYFFDLRKRITK